MTKTKSEIAKSAPAEMAKYDYGQNAGAGWQNVDSSFYSIPFINLLQQLSPEVEEGGQAQVEGAKAGMFVNSVTKELRTELILVPAVIQHSYVEWVPRAQGGGFVGTHDPASEVVAKAKAKAKDLRKLQSEAGNDLVDTFTMFALRLDTVDDAQSAEVVVLSFTKTKIKRFRDLITKLRTWKAPGLSAQGVPLFAYRIKLGVSKEKNGAGQPYFNVTLEPALGNPMLSLIPPAIDGKANPLLAEGKALMDAINAGKAKANYENAGNDAAGGEPRDEVF